MTSPRGKIPLLSFFSGAGFLDIGFLRSDDFHIPWHNECHRPFASAYEHGVSRLGYNTGSEKIQNKEKMESLTAARVVKEAFNGRKPSVFGIIGGPPCPDFSRGGKNNGKNGKNGKLTGKFANIILELRPTFFLIENVPGLVETKKHRKFLFALLKRLGESYAIDMKILNAMEYGVPQNRRRVFVVGFCKKWLSKKPQHKSIIANSDSIIAMKALSKTNPEMMDDLSDLHWFNWPKPKAKFKGALSRFEWNKKSDSTGKRPDELTVQHHFKKAAKHPNAKDHFRPHSKKFLSIKEGDTSRKSFKRLHRYGYSPNAAYGNNEVHLHPTQNRRISVAEALALQSVPGKYAFPDEMTLTDKFKAVGNGVPVLLAEQVALSLSNFLTHKE